MSDPAPTPDSRQRALLDRIEAILDAQIRAGLRADGGDIEVVGIDADNIVQIRLRGACQSCPSATLTLTMGIEATLKEQIPELRFLEAVP